MVGTVRRSVYRQPVTANGLRKIEEGTLEWFDTEMFANFNTGVLEQYLDDKNRRESFQIPAWDWKKIWIAILVGSLFALVNQYVGLKVGMVVAGSWYIMFLLGLAFKWSPGEINVSSTASNGAAMICTGFVFTFPAIYLLAVGGVLGEQYRSWDPTLGEAGAYIPVIPNSIIGIALVATILSGILGVMYFIIFRRIWLVEDPLPVPGFEATVKLLDLSHSIGKGSSEEAKRSVRLASLWIGGVSLFTFLRDFPIGEQAILDQIFGGDYYHNGDIMQPLSDAEYTHFTFTLIPIQFGLGWFMKFKVALLIFLGTAFTWFVVIPLAVGLNVPYFYAEGGENGVDIAIQSCWGLLRPDLINLPVTPAYAAYDIARVMAIGCILGGGFTALIKMAPVFKTVTSDMLKASKTDKGNGKGKSKPDGGGGDNTSENIESKGIFIPYRGWYEWPASHIKLMLIITFIGVSIIFIVGGFPIVHSIIFSILLVFTTFFLGAIAVKVMGETGTEPVSATSFIVLLMLFGTFMGLNALPGIDIDVGALMIMALVGTTVFGGAISMSGDIILNFKNGIYCGNRPYHLVKALTPGIIPGTIIAALAGALLSIGLSTGVLNLVAPQAHAFEIFAKILMQSRVNIGVFVLGIFLGIFMELLIGMGTAFGLGMYLPLGIQIPMLLGGAGRDLWEKKLIEPRAKAENWSERKRTLKLLDSYMMATGMIVGEAIMGTIIAVYLVLPLITGSA